MEWKPASIESVRRIVRDDMANCDQKQVAAFEAYRVEPRLAPIVRDGKLENVVVIAQKENQVIYWEDVEEGFGVSPVGTDGQILQHDCNQNDLGSRAQCVDYGAWLVIIPCTADYRSGPRCK